MDRQDLVIEKPSGKSVVQTRAHLEVLIERAIEALDVIDGDPEAEPDDWDKEDDDPNLCPAGDDCEAE